MASIITPAELRTALNGVSSSLYSDAVLTEIIDTAESVVGNLLVKWNVPINQHKHAVATKTTLHTTRPHKFHVGQTVVMNGIEAHINGSKTIAEIVDEYTFTITTSAVTVHDWYNVIPNGLASANDLSQYDDVAPVESAVLTVSLDVFKARTSAGSVQQGLDFVPQPYILGRTIQNRIVGMLGAYLDVEALIG
jgi:sulfur carrier protein ThiS